MGLLKSLKKAVTPPKQVRKAVKAAVTGGNVFKDTPLENAAAAVGGVGRKVITSYADAKTDGAFSKAGGFDTLTAGGRMAYGEETAADRAKLLGAATSAAGVSQEFAEAQRAAKEVEEIFGTPGARAAGQFMGSASIASGKAKPKTAANAPQLAASSGNVTAAATQSAPPMPAQRSIGQMIEDFIRKLLGG